MPMCDTEYGANLLWCIWLIILPIIVLLFCRWADRLMSEGTNPKVEHTFNHPYFQVRKAVCNQGRVEGEGYMDRQIPS